MTIDEATGRLAWTSHRRTRAPTHVAVVAQNEAGVAQQDFLVDVQCQRGCGGGAGERSSPPFDRLPLTQQLSAGTRGP